MKIDINYYYSRPKDFLIRKTQWESEFLYNIRYKHQAVDFTDWRARIARGLVLNEAGEVVVCGFEKFFCWKQLENREELSLKFKKEFSHLDLREDKVYRCEEKKDGTLILASIYHNELILSTSSNIDDVFTQEARKIILSDPNYKSIKEFLEEYNACLAFELVGRKNVVVVNYPEELHLCLLEGFTKEDCKPMFIQHSKKYKEFRERFQTPAILDRTLEELQEMQKNAQDIEGVIIINSYGRRIKVKTNWWYEEKYHGFSDKSSKGYKLLDKDQNTCLFNISKAVIHNEIDDLVAAYNQNLFTSQLNKVSEWSSKCEETFNQINDIVDNFSKKPELIGRNYKDHDQDRKALAIAVAARGWNVDLLYKYMKRKLFF